MKFITSTSDSDEEEVEQESQHQPLRFIVEAVE